MCRTMDEAWPLTHERHTTNCPPYLRSTTVPEGGGSPVQKVLGGLGGLRRTRDSTQKAEFMVQHLANDVVEPYQYTQLLAPFAWQGIFRMDARDSLSDPAATI